MDVVQKESVTGQRREPAADLAEMLGPGVLVLTGGRAGEVAFADPRAMDLLGCADRAGLERLWSDLAPRLRDAGGRALLEVSTAGPGGGERRLAFDWRPAGAGSLGDDTAGGGVLLIQDAGVDESLNADLRHASLLRSLAQITPAVAHDLRAPINAMVFNIEILKETIAAGKGAEPAGRDRQLRYVEVLREELHRLHQGLETYIAQISPRGDRDETLDLREPIGELAALLVGPARKQQARVAAELPETKVLFAGNRFLIRQALLHVAVAALRSVPRDGVLAIRLERHNGHARIRFAGAGTPAGAASGTGEPGFGIAASPLGTQAQLWAARSILAGLGGDVHAAGEPPEYEVELSVTQDLGSQEKE